MKYHLVIWTDDGIKELDINESLAAHPLRHFHPTTRLAEGFVHITDSLGKEWFFNWNHILGGTIQKMEGE